jgi:mannose-1-phosphate guanylyltransferase/mannose-1-phosphate guanylyltransferase/mannose-6-phosphate isomerase
MADATAFVLAIAAGAEAANHGALVTFGVKPDHPHTGYGYIETENGPSPDLKVRRFV